VGERTRNSRCIRRVALPSSEPRLQTRGVSNSEDPDFSFGLIADVQYADDDTSPQLDRHYRASLAKLAEAVTEFNRHDLAFIVHLGDLVDHDLDNVGPVMERFGAARAPVRQVLGNHDFTSRTSPTGVSEIAEVHKAFGLADPYYSFDLQGWRFLVLNTNEVGTIAHAPGTEGWQHGRQLLDRLAEQGRPNAYPWNGTIGAAQREWLSGQLVDAEQNGLKAFIFAHHPLFPDHEANLLDDRELRSWLVQFPALKAWLNGHQHLGGYGQISGLHFVTACGVVETAENAYGIARVFGDRVEITGYHRQPSRVLTIR
jgi:manganese-dependent ADP-ribose/CDP-alcohol diphosphatase